MRYSLCEVRKADVLHVDRRFRVTADHSGELDLKAESGEIKEFKYRS